MATPRKKKKVRRQGEKGKNVRVGGGEARNVQQALYIELTLGGEEIKQARATQKSG